MPPEPDYIDYGMYVIYEGDTVYLDNKPIPTKKYDGQLLDAAAKSNSPRRRCRRPIPSNPPNGCRSAFSLSCLRNGATRSCSSSSR